MLGIIGLFFKGIISKVMGFLVRVPWQIWAILGVVAALLFAWHVHTNAEKAAYKGAFNAGFAVERARAEKVFAVQRASITTLQAAINEQNNAIGKMVDESNARLKAGTDALAVAKQGRAATQSAIQALQASADRAAKVGPCVASEAFIAHSGEL